MKITFLDAETLGDDMIPQIKRLFGGFGEVVMRNATTEDEVDIVIEDSDVLVVNKVRLNGGNLGAAKRLKLICEAATGYDNIDVDYCRQHGIAVCNVRGYSTDSVAQLTVAAAMTLICHMPQYMEYVENGDYTKSGVANRLVPVYHEICGSTWGIVGAGNIGRRVAGIAAAMGCRVIVNKRTPSENMECVDIDTLCRTSDIISVHTPLTEETRGLISRERIGMMKPDAVFINMARGAVADETALTEAIEQGRLGGLAVDVYTSEPLPKGHPYQRILRHPNTCFTPHNAWGAYEARLRCLETISKNIKSYIEGRCENRIDLKEKQRF